MTLAVTSGVAASHWRRRPLQFLFLILGLALATALWSGVQAINAEARAAYDKAAALLARDRLERLVAAEGDGFDVARFVALRRQGWAVSPVLEGRDRSRGVTYLGIDPLTLPRAAEQAALAGDAAGLLALVGPDGRILIHPETAARLNGRDLPEAILSDDMPPGTVLGDLAVIARILDSGTRISRLVLDPAAPPGLVPLAELAPDLRRIAPEDGTDLARLTDSFHLNLTAFGVLAFGVGLFIAQSVIGLAFEERRGALRTLRALGVPFRQVILALCIEFALLALLAGGLGLLIGYGVAAVLLPDVAASLRGLYGAEVEGTLAFRPSWALAGLAMALGGTALAAAQAIWQVARMPVLAPAMPRAWARASARSSRRLGMAGAALLALAAGLAAFDTGDSLWRAFLLVAALLLGAALVLPPVLWLALGAIRRLSPGGPRRDWFWAETSGQMPSLALALMALCLAFATNIGVSTMVESFRATFTGWLDQRLAAELYVSARDDAEARAILAEVTSEVDAVLPIASVPATLAGQPGDVYAMADHATYRDVWPMLLSAPDLWPRLHAGEGVIVNEQLWRRAGLSLDAPVALPGGALPLLGVYSDYGNPNPQAILGAGEHARRFPGTDILRFGLRLDPDEARALGDRLQTRFDLPPGAVQPAAEVKRYSIDIFNRTFLVSGALNVLTLGVAAVALFASLLTLAERRLPQIAPLWAMGETRARLGAAELLRVAVLAALTLLLACPLGLGLAWALLDRVNVAAFGWQVPMQVFPADIARLAVWSLAAALAAAAVPALSLARVRPAELLKVFAHER